MQRSSPGLLAIPFATLLFAVLFISGCGGSSKQVTPPPQNQPVTITTQPASATVPLDSTGTFTVVATGTGPLSYQWSKNGETIPGATNSAYTTPSIGTGDSGDKYTVTVSNSVNSLVSSQAVLTVGPRSPKSGDIRFKLVVSGLINQVTSSSNSELMMTFQPSFSSAFASPLQIGDGACAPARPYPNCSWVYDVYGLPSESEPLSVSMKAGYISNFESDLAGFNTPDTVIQSLDFQTGVGAYGSEWLTIQGGQFDLIERIVSSGAIASTAAADGLNSRVITAVTFDSSNQAHLMSYGWQGDSSTQYDTSVSIVDPQDVVTAAEGLANAGYIITAFGGDDTNGYVLVGTKVQGDSMPRPLQAFPQSNQSGPWIGVANIWWNENTSGGSSSAGTELILEQ